MNKEITIYELLGLIKDGQAPKRIKYKDKIYYYYHNMVDLHKYETMPTENRRSLSLILDNEYLNLNDKVEIIEEDNKIKKIKELNNVGNSEDLGEFKDKQQLNNHILKDKINELVDEIKKLKENNEN